MSELHQSNGITVWGGVWLSVCATTSGRWTHTAVVNLAASRREVDVKKPTFHHLRCCLSSPGAAVKCIMQNKSCHWNISVFLLSNICLAYKETRSITKCSQAKIYCVLHWLLFENDIMGSQWADVSILWRFSLLCVNRAADKSQAALRNTWEKKHITFILCTTASETFFGFWPLKMNFYRLWALKPRTHFPLQDLNTFKS